MTDTHHVHLRWIEAGNQEDNISAHLLIRGSILAIIKPSLNCGLVGGREIVLTQILQRQFCGDQKSGQPPGERTQRVVHPSGTSHGVHGQNFTVVIRAQMTHHPEHGGALGVADVLDSRLARLLNYVIDHGGQVKLSYFVPGEPPECLARGVQRTMAGGVPVTTTVAHPHVIACGLGKTFI